MWIEKITKKPIYVGIDLGVIIPVYQIVSNIKAMAFVFYKVGILPLNMMLN